LSAAGDLSSERVPASTSERFRTDVRRRIADAKAVAAGLTMTIEFESASAAWRERTIWLGAVASDGRSDAGLIGELVSGAARQGREWSAERRVDFDQGSIAELLAARRETAVGVINLGLRDAHKARRRR